MSTTTDYQRLQRMVRDTVDQIAQEQAHRLNVTVKPGFVESLGEIVYKQIETFALDTEKFASHARRVVINADDVILCSRRNDDLHDMLMQKREELLHAPSSKR